jgi:serine/threonine protein kinase
VSYNYRYHNSILLLQTASRVTWSAKCASTKNIVAVVVTPKAKLCHESVKTMVLNEVTHIKTLHHTNIVAHVDEFEDNDNQYLVHEQCSQVRQKSFFIWRFFSSLMSYFFLLFDEKNKTAHLCFFLLSRGNFLVIG